MNDSQKTEKRVEPRSPSDLVPLNLHNQLTAGPSPWTDTRIPAQVFHVTRAVFGTSSYEDEQRVYRTLQAALHVLAESEAPTQPLTAAATDVLGERRRQVEAEGYDTGHDDEHDNGSMAEAAAAYAYQAHNSKSCPAGKPPLGWPWDSEWWKPADPRRMLVKAGALILAEIERLDREAFHTAPLPSHDPVSTR
jgi:hypothetical protein